MRIDGEIEGVTCQLVIDTGSNFTIVRPDIIKEAKVEGKIIPIDTSLRTVTGESAPVVGRANLRFRLGDWVTYQEVWLADVTDPCILGLDFLMAHDCHVDIAGGALQIGQQEIPLVLDRQSNNQPSCRRVVVAETVEIPPRCESVVYGSLRNGGDVVDVWGSVGPLQQRNTHASQGILVGRTLVDLRSPEGLPVRVLNLSDKVRYLKKGTEVADFEPVAYAVSMEKEQTTPVVPNTDTGVPAHLVDLFNRSGRNLNVDQQGELKNLLVQFQDASSKDKHDLGRTGLAKHKIDVETASPIRQPTRIPPLAKREEASNAINDMKEQGIIEPSKSPWVSPVVLVRKKDGGTRFCVDYRKLNAVTKKDSYPLPTVDTSLHSFFGSTWFSTLDLRSGYWHLAGRNGRVGQGDDSVYDRRRIVAVCSYAIWTKQCPCNL